MADVFVSVPLETDPDALASDVFDELGLAIPDWTPAPASLDTILIESLAFLIGELMTVASDVDAAIFRYLGIQLVGVQPIDASSAAATTTWTMTDDQGHTVPAGTVVTLKDSAGERVGFETLDEALVPGGDTDVTIVLSAIEPGAAGSALSGDVELADSLAFVDSIVLDDDETTGGVDAEADEDYLNRLSRELELLAPRPILPDDFAVMAKRIGGVARATAIDNYNPADATYNNERMVTVAVVGADGEALSSQVKLDVDALLEERREVNFIVHVVDPTYTTIDVTFTAVAYAGYVAATVEEAAEAAITEYLSPANFGLSQFGEELSWVNETKVRYLELAEVLNRVEGLHYISTLQLRESGGALATADVDLDGPAGLTLVGVISGTVT